MNINKAYKVFLFGTFIYMFAIPVFGQTDLRSVSNHAVLLGINSDGFLGLDCEYNYKTSLKINDNHIYIKSGMEMPVLINIREGNIKDWALKSAVESYIFKNSKYNVGLTVSLNMIRHTQELGDFFAIGNNLKLTPCVIFESMAYFGIHLEFINTMATHIQPSEYVKSTFSGIYDSGKNLIDDSAVSGWYKSTGTYFKTGLEFFTPVFPKTGMYIDVGVQNFNSKYFSYFDNMTTGFIPFYLSLSFTHFI